MSLTENELLDILENIQFKLRTKMTPAQKADWQFLLERYQAKLAQVKKLNNAFPTITSIRQNGNH